MKLFTFPNPANEIAARVVAGGVVVMGLLVLIPGWNWLLVALAYGFVARVLNGPTFSPLGQFVTRVLTPNLPFAAKHVPGPPKRFAQGIGATLSLSACVAAFGFANWTVAIVLVALITLAATLESVLGLCLGCTLFAMLMRAGVIPESVCERCADIWATNHA